jgi:hypothetical protein
MHYGLNICASEALWMELCKSVDVTGYLACRIAGRGILDENILGEALSRVEGLYKGIPHSLPIKLSVCDSQTLNFVFVFPSVPKISYVLSAQMD